MTKEELIKYFKNLTEITKKDNTKDLEVGVEISVEMAERLIDIIEKQQKEIENSVSKDKIREKIEEYLEFDKKYKTYTKDGRENFSMEYFKAKALKELLEE